MQLVLDVLSWICLPLGSLFCMIGAIGVLRLPDLYTRTHAATITDTLGAGLMLVGLTLQADTANTAIKLVMVMLFLLCTSPLSGHALVKAAHYHGFPARLLKHNDLDSEPKEDADVD